MNENIFDDQGRISISSEQTEYEVKTASTITIPVLVRNQGLEEDRFVLSV